MASLHKRICTRVLGVSLPHILEPLGTPEKCRNLLEQAGFKDIEIQIVPSGRYRNLMDNRLSCTVIKINFQDNPLLSKLSQEQLEQLQDEYRLEIEKLTSDRGFWEDTTKFFVCGRK
jgi:hypothetical protein